jgi:glycosyltransferase involved in cell wall biosynthesis
VSQGLPRALLLATYFPKPTHPTLGTWALFQAQALRRHGLPLEVCSLTSWVPSPLRVSPRARPWIDCPREHAFGGLVVHYPRWPLYQFGRLKRSAHENPWPQLSFAWRVARRRVMALVETFRPEVLLAHHTGTNGYVAAEISRATGIPYVVVDHDNDEITDCHRFPARKALFDHVAERAFAMVAGSRGTSRLLANVLPRARVETVYLGTDPVTPSVLDTPRPPELAERVVIFTAAKLYDRKGVPLLVEAFARVAARHPKALLRIAGDGVERPLVEAAIARHGLAAQVQLLGLQPHDRVMQEMAWCDLFALVGWNEPWGVVFTEAMSVGKPVVVSRDAGVSEVLTDGVDAVLVEPKHIDSAAAALERLLASAELRMRIGTRAKETFERRLTWDKAVEPLAALLAAAADRRG